jgi:hypothetical protein
MPPKRGTLAYELWKNSPQYMIGEKNPNYKGKYATLEWREKVSRSLIENHRLFPRHHTEESKQKISVGLTGKKHPCKGHVVTQATRMKMSIRMAGINHPMYGKHHTSASREKMSKSQKNNGKIVGYHKGHIPWNKGKKYPEYTGENSPLYGIVRGYETRLRVKEAKVGGFWYGNVRYGERKYCELWNRDLWNRIDKAQNNQSILSGKTKEDNGGCALSRHHIYWQPKACCEWDEDAQGYYAWINIGLRSNTDKIKYYIKGDPNKFVLLTKREHGVVAKDKIKWIKIFEDLIETKLGGACYLPKSEP